MKKNIDYRNTEYCKELEEVEDKKKRLERQIETECPKTKIFYNKIKGRDSEYHQKFAEIYNEKCAYCGISLGLLPLECFEIDHYIHEASFTKSQEGRIKAGRLKNLIWTCVSCNRGKSGILIEPAYLQKLNTDDGNIARVFERDDDCSIQIKAEYKDDKFIKKFYDALGMGFERRRIDYLLLEMQGKKDAEQDAGKKAVLGNAIHDLLTKRNRKSCSKHSK